jgi:deazaflavin-dependent oxidoreductase (nitroreductase family)
MFVRWLAKSAMALYVALYRWSKGGVGGGLSGMPVLLLTTTGRKSGKSHTIPVMYLREGSNYIVTASNGGRDSHPAWWLNMQRNRQALIEVKDVRQSVVAEPVSPEERRRLWTQLVEQAPFFEDYQKRASRDIPMAILRPVDSHGA